LKQPFIVFMSACLLAACAGGEIEPLPSPNDTGGDTLSDLGGDDNKEQGSVVGGDSGDSAGTPSGAVTGSDDDGGGTGDDSGDEGGSESGNSPDVIEPADTIEAVDAKVDDTGADTGGDTDADATTTVDATADTAADAKEALTTSKCQNVVCSASDQCHNVGTCDSTSGVCSDPAKTDGADCDDGNACTQTDGCQAGSCVGVDDVVCTASDQCHDVGTCDSTSGVCSDPAKTDGADCDDGDNTTNDGCVAGACVGLKPGQCQSAKDCDSLAMCVTTDAPQMCGICFSPPNICNDDTECKADDPNFVCKTVACACSGEKTCQPGCMVDATLCKDWQVCDPGGQCVPTPCALDNDCLPSFECGSGQCQRKKCANNSDCPAWCVKGKCYAVPGNCMFPPP
jgi:hypothetical protein